MSQSSNGPAITPRRGRPRKFTGPSRAVTLTLPEDVLAALDAIDHDLSRAVVRLAQPEMAKRPHPPAELAQFGRRAVIVVNPTKTLEQRTGVLLIPLSDGRALISFDRSLTTALLELGIQDELDDHALPREDARVFTAIRDLLKSARRSRAVALQQHNIIVLEYARKQPANGQPRGKARPGKRVDAAPVDGVRGGKRAARGK